MNAQREEIEFNATERIASYRVLDEIGGVGSRNRKGEIEINWIERGHSHVRIERRIGGWIRIAKIEESGRAEGGEGNERQRLDWILLL